MNNAVIKKYLTNHILITIVILGGVVALHLTSGMGKDLPINVFAVIWASLLTGVAFLIANRGVNGTPGQFSNAVVSGMMLKLLFSLGFIGLVLYLSTVDRKAFIASYFTAFFLLSGFEVYSLMNNLRPK